MLTFASFPVGATGTLPSKLVTREEITRFAREFDPQPMHLDEAAAARTLLGGLSASGWHTCAMLMRMICDGYLDRTASLGSPGIPEVRWLQPVKPGDTLTATYEVKEARLSAKRPEMGVCRVAYDMRNQLGASVMTWDCIQFFETLLAAGDSRSESRPPAAATLEGTTSPGASLNMPAPGGRLSERESPGASKDSESPGAGEDCASKDSNCLFLEDYHPGDTVDLGSHTFTADAIKAFARAYDPQPLHLDEAAAERSLFGGLCASGWHTAAVWMKLMIAHQTAAVAAITARGERAGRLGPSPGFRDLRWLEPVRPGDTLTYSSRATAIEERPGRQDWGLLRMSNEGRNQHGRLVFAFDGRVLVERRGVQRT